VLGRQALDQRFLDADAGAVRSPPGCAAVVELRLASRGIVARPDFPPRRACGEPSSDPNREVHADGGAVAHHRQSVARRRPRLPRQPTPWPASGCCAAGARPRPARAPRAPAARRRRSGRAAPSSARTSRRPGCRASGLTPRRSRPAPPSARRRRRAGPSRRAASASLRPPTRGSKTTARPRSPVTVCVVGHQRAVSAVQSANARAGGPATTTEKRSGSITGRARSGRCCRRRDESARPRRQRAP
jgi:hypothetical protein